MNTPTRGRTLPPGTNDAIRQLVQERDALTEQLAQLRLELAELRTTLLQLQQTPRAAPSATSGRFETPPLPAMHPLDPPMSGLFATAGSGVSAPQQGIDFGAVAKLSPAALDALPYGLITLDAAGRVLHYNDTEARLVGLPKERVLGRSFFGEVAPCTRVREFQGRFEELVRDPVRVRVQTFDFVFRFQHAEHHVSITITPARVRGQFHVALVRRAILARSGA